MLILLQRWPGPWRKERAPLPLHLLGQDISQHRAALLSTLEDRSRRLTVGFDYEGSRLSNDRRMWNGRLEAGDPQAIQKLAYIKDQQKALEQTKLDTLAALKT